MQNKSLVWLTQTQIDKDVILDFIAAHSIQSALEVDKKIKTQVAQLLKFPYLGRAGRIENTFELVISRTPYLVAYQIKNVLKKNFTMLQIQVIHVFHVRQDWPPR